MTIYDIFMLFYDVMSMGERDRNCQKMWRTLVQSTQAGKLAKRKPSCSHAAHRGSPRELGKLLGVSSQVGLADSGSTLCVQAARSSVQEVGPHSSELAVLFAKEKGVLCRTRIWRRRLMMPLKMA